MPHQLRILLTLLFCLLGTLAALAAPTQVWVDARYGPGAAGEHTFGVTAFSTIQEGITAVASEGTVFVAPGVYAERVLIPKPLTLRGPQAGVNPNAPSAADPFAGNPARRDPAHEAIIVPPTRDLTLAGGTIVTIAADHVTVAGFTVDGRHSALMEDLESDSLDLDHFDKHAALGIGSLTGDWQGVLISHNIITNCVRGGVRFDCPALPAQAKGINVVRYNRIAHLASEGLGVRANGQHLHVADNTIWDVPYGIQMHFVSSTEGTAAPQVIGNAVEATKAGIMMVLLNDRTRRAGPQALVHRNTVQMTTGTGLVIFYIEHQTKLLVSDNTLQGGDAGIQLWELPTYNPTNVTIANTTIRDARYGIWFRNYREAPQTGPARASGAVVSNVTILNAREAGVYLEDHVAGNSTVTLTALGLTVQGGPVGLRLRGSRAVVEGDMTLTGQTDEAITLEAGAVLPAFAR